MSWSGWSARLNVTSIVSQGLEQVSKLKEDVEKQFDQAVQSAAAKSAASGSSPSGSNGGIVPVATPAAALPGPDLFGNSAVRQTDEGASSIDSSAARPPMPILKTVDDINVVVKSPQWSGTSAMSRASLQHQQIQQPPYSADGKRRPTVQADFLTAARFPALKPTSNGALEVNAVARESGAAAVAHAEDASLSGIEGNAESEEKKPSERTESSATAAVEHGSEGDVLKTREAEDAVSEPPNEAAEREAQDYSDDVEDEEAQHDTDVSIPVAVDESDHTEFSSSAELVPSAEPASTEHARLRDHQEEDGVDDGTTGKDDAAPIPPSIAEQNHISHAEDESPEHSVSSDAAAMAKEIASLRQHLRAREDQLMATSSTIQELHDELDKTCHREVTAVERARFLTEQLELMRLEVSKLNRMAAVQRDGDLQAMQLALSEKDEKLKALLEEGQALSIKQAQFEQRVRQLRKEKNEEEELRLKLQAQFDTIAIQFQDQSAKLKVVEEDNKRHVQEIRQLQSTADNATKQLAKAEQDTATYETQLEQLNAQVEQLSQRNSDMEREIVEMKDASHSNAALSSEKAELEQTIRFLHQSLQDLEEESSRREDMARAEILDLKRKWQDAVGRVDMMGQSVSDATQPLLRQISALQEDQRARQETWRATEATLLARIQETSESRRTLEQDKLQRDEQIHALQTRIDTLEQDLKRRVSELSREKEKVESALASERECQAQLDAVAIERDEWKSRLQSETHAKEQLQLRLTNERKSASDATQQQQTDTASASELEEARAREAQLRHDLEWHQKELRRLKTLQPPTSTGSLNGGGVGSSRGSSSNLHRASMDSESSNGTVVETQASILKLTLESTDDDALLGGTSVLGMSQLQQRLRLKEGENRLVKQQLNALEAKQSQLTEEIVRLSTRNALLETNEARFQQTQEELAELKQRQHVLLELFGEKEEQVEELQAEVSELKAFYRQQLDTLAKHQEQQ